MLESTTINPADPTIQSIADSILVRGVLVPLGLTEDSSSRQGSPLGCDQAGGPGEGPLQTPQGCSPTGHRLVTVTPR